MSAISMILVVIVAFFAGLEGILDQFQFHQPLIACTLIGLVTGNLTAGIMLGGSLQMIALGWANIGAAVAPDAALAAVASAIILVKGGQGTAGISTAIAVAIIHIMDKEAEKGNFRGIEVWQFIALLLQGLRIALPAAFLLVIPTSAVRSFLESMPAWLTDGMAIGGGMVVAVGYAMVINMMASREVWPFFIIGFVIAAVSQLTLIAIGALGIAFALIYLELESKGGSGNGGSSNTGDPLGDILDDY